MAARLSNGCKLALPVDYAGVSMAMIQPILDSGVRDLDLVCVPTGGLQADILIGAGRVRSLETSAMTLGEAGGAPCFIRAMKSGALKMRDSTCPAIHAGLMAAQKDLPFLPIRGLIGTDVLRHRADWKIIQNPMVEAEDKIVIVPPIAPDFSLFHAPLADKDGNVWIGRRKELAAMAYAAKRTIVTVEKIVDGNLFDDENLSAGIIPSLYIDAVAEAEFGARPYGLWAEYGKQTEVLMEYAAQAKTEDGFAAYLSEKYGAEVLT
ncbi:MAG: CoA synthetase [Rhodobacteraceae bacterium]|nr:CoA synthetase [Paracoccaceae bacterium]